MPTNHVTLWNQAAAIVGGNAKGLIQSSVEESSIADYCRAFWNEAVDVSLIFLRPVEAIKFVNIAASSDTPENSDWTYIYDLPADYLDLIVYADDADRTQNNAFEIVGDYIFSDVNECYLKYLAKMDYEDTTKMSVGLRQLAVANLAVMIAPFYKPGMLQIAEGKLAKAEQRSSDMSTWHGYEEKVTSSADIT